MEALYPEDGPAGFGEIVEALLRERGAGRDRPHVFTNFAVTVDGRATIDGRSGPIGSAADTELLMRLREAADAVMIGAGTLRAERYGRVVPSAERRERRVGYGLAPDPLMVLVTGTMNLPWDVELFSSGEGEVLILTLAADEPPATETPVATWRFEGSIDFAAAMRRLRAERGVRSLLSEGGPHLHGSMVEAGIIDDLFVTIGPKLAGGGAYTLIEGIPEGVRDLRLVSLLREGDELFARWALSA